MALVRIAGSALGSVNKNLEGGKIDNAISATFACDNVTSALLLAGPSAALSIMFVFSRIELTQLWSEVFEIFLNCVIIKKSYVWSRFDHMCTICTKNDAYK